MLCHAHTFTVVQICKYSGYALVLAHASVHTPFICKFNRKCGNGNTGKHCCEEACKHVILLSEVINKSDAYIHLPVYWSSNL